MDDVARLGNANQLESYLGLVAKRDLVLERELSRLDRFDAVILDDIGYVQQSDSSAGA